MNQMGFSCSVNYACLRQGSQGQEDSNNAHVADAEIQEDAEDELKNVDDDEASTPTCRLGNILTS